MYWFYISVPKRAYAKLTIPFIKIYLSPIGRCWTVNGLICPRLLKVTPSHAPQFLTQYFFLLMSVKLCLTYYSDGPVYLLIIFCTSRSACDHTMEIASTRFFVYYRSHSCCCRCLLNSDGNWSLLSSLETFLSLGNPVWGLWILAGMLED